MQILIKPKSFYNNTILKANPIYIDRIKETFKTAKEAWVWADGLREKTIYLFDGSDPMNLGGRRRWDNHPINRSQNGSNQ